MIINSNQQQQLIHQHQIAHPLHHYNHHHQQPTTDIREQNESLLVETKQLTSNQSPPGVVLRTPLSVTGKQADQPSIDISTGSERRQQKEAAATMTATSNSQHNNSNNGNVTQSSQITSSTATTRNHRLESKQLSVVLPQPTQKTLLTPTIITTSDLNSLNGLQNGAATAATPIRLFNSLVPADVGLFTGLPSCTPTSADGLAATSNPFFYGVSPFPSGSSHTTLTTDCAPFGSQQENLNLARQQSVTMIDQEQNLNSNPSDQIDPMTYQHQMPQHQHQHQHQQQQQQQQQQHRHNQTKPQQHLAKLSLDQIQHRANVMMLSPLFLPLSPEQEAWLRQLSLNNQNNQIHQDTYQQAYHQQQQQQQQDHFQQQIAAARAAQDLTNQVVAASTANNNNNNNNNNQYTSQPINNTLNCQIAQQQPLYQAARLHQHHQPHPQTNGNNISFAAAAVEQSAESHHQKQSGFQLISTSNAGCPASYSQASTYNQAQVAPVISRPQVNLAASKTANQPHPSPNEHKTQPAVHNQTSSIQAVVSDQSKSFNMEQTAVATTQQAAVTSGSGSSSVARAQLTKPTIASEFLAYSNSNSNCSLTFDRSSSVHLNNSSEPRSSVSRETINVDLSSCQSIARKISHTTPTTTICPNENSDTSQQKTNVLNGNSKKRKENGKKLINLQNGTKQIKISQETTAINDIEPVKKKSKGGRKKKLITAEEMVARKNRSKERNRVAAKRCRQKRKAFVDELRDKIDSLNDLNRKLQKENTMLKSELERHKCCRI